MIALNHVCIRVLDLDRSVKFYKETLDLDPVKEMTLPDQGWELVFLGDGVTEFQLELCKEVNRTEPYALGDDTPHIALVVKEFAEVKEKHREMGLICDELHGGIYFIKDPDGHLMEILPVDR